MGKAITNHSPLYVMHFSRLLELVSLSDLRNIFFGTVIILSGLALATLTLIAHQTGNQGLAGIAAAASLVFVLLILIFVVPPLARSASAEAAQMDLPVEITGGGGIFFILLLIVAFAAWNTGNNLLFIVLSFLLSALIIAFLVGTFCLRRLDVKMRFPEAIYAEEPTPIMVSLHNRKRLFPTFSVVAEVRGREKERSDLLDELKGLLPRRILERIIRPPLIKYILDYFVYVPRRLAEENRVEQVFPRRGRFLVKDFELSTKFPFGILRHRRRLPAQEAEIIIFPRIEQLDKAIAFRTFDYGSISIQKRGTGQDLLALRSYQPQDDLRHIDWKATARAQNLTVREFVAEDEKRVTVVFDPRFPQDAEKKEKTLRQRIEEEQKGKRELSASERRFENGVSLAASVLAQFIDERIEVSLIINDDKGDFGIDRTHLNACLKRLALVEPVEPDTAGVNLDRLLADRQNSYIFLISAVDIKEFDSSILAKTEIISY
jgi:uncharacterized protein (DUF58 family)